MQGGGSRDRPEYPEVADRVGTDPARFLAVRGDAVGSRHETGGDGLLLARARIKGIDDFVTIAGWRQVATDLNDRGVLGDAAYEDVVGRLDDRADWLREHDEREARMGQQGRREIDPDLVARTGDPDHGQSGDALEQFRRNEDKTTKPKGRRQAVTDGGDRDV